MENQDSKVSIIINTRNEEKNIRNLLESCKNQSYKDVEILIIDNNSNDKTKTISEEYTKLVYNKGPERSIQKNYGAQIAKGMYVLFLDADMAIDREVISDCVRIAHADPSIKAIIIPEKSFGNTFWAKCKALERNCYIGDDTIEAARFFDRNIYLELGGYNEKMISGEDWDLTHRIRSRGYKISRTEKLIHHNEGNLTLLKTLKKKYYYAKNATPYIDSNVGGIKDIILFIFRPAYFRNWKLLLKDPLHAFGFVIMKFLEISVGTIPVIINKFFNR